MNSYKRDGLLNEGQILSKTEMKQIRGGLRIKTSEVITFCYACGERLKYIGMLTYECPKCGKIQNEKSK